MWEPVDEPAVFLAAESTRLVGVWKVGDLALGLLTNPAGVLTVMFVGGPWIVGVAVGYGWQGVGTCRIDNDLLALYVVCAGLVGIACGRRKRSDRNDVPFGAAVFA